MGSHLDWMGVGGLVLGVVGIAISIVIYAKTREVKRLSYMARTFPLITEEVLSIPNLEGLYEKLPLVRLTGSKMVVWNSGNQLIKKADIARADPLRMLFNGTGDVLEVKIAAQSDAANHFAIVDKLEGEPLTLTLEFDYIAKNQGCVISILHTGNITEHPVIVGTVMDRRGRPNLIRTIAFRRRVRTFVFKIAGILVGTMLAQISQYFIGWGKALIIIAGGLIGFFIIRRFL
jgi:hypothetical protein